MQRRCVHCEPVGTCENWLRPGYHFGLSKNNHKDNEIQSIHIHPWVHEKKRWSFRWRSPNQSKLCLLKVKLLFLQQSVKDRLHQITVEVSGTLLFSISVDFLCRVAPWNYFHRRLRKRRKRKTWSLISLDELATFCATFSTPGMEPDGSQRQKKKYGGQGQQIRKFTSEKWWFQRV